MFLYTVKEGRNMSENYSINVMMFGGRRCGKTSVLAAMQSSFEKSFGKGNLTISTADDDTLFTIEEKKREINNYFIHKGQSREFVPDDTPTTEVMEYKFEIGLKHKSNGSIIVNFIDYPGEWLGNKENFSKIKDIMKKSNVVIVAIDTPYLMEQTHSDAEEAVGEFNDRRNYSERIGEMLKKNFELNNGIKMVLFVPLKCEKYLHEGKMPLVYKKIRKAYETTFNYLDGNNKQKCIVAVTPIITFGCAEFQRFERDENHNIILDENYHLPKKALYIFTDTRYTEPQSQYCEQPMVYILAYVFEMARRLKENNANSSGFFGKIINWFEESFLNMPSADDYLLELDNVKKAMKTNDAQAGYYLVNNPLKF